MYLLTFFFCFWSETMVQSSYEFYDCSSAITFTWLSSSSDSGGWQFVARGLERSKLPVWPRTFGEHADLLGAQTDTDCTFGRTGLQRGALNNLFLFLDIYFFISAWSDFII